MIHQRASSRAGIKKPEMLDAFSSVNGVCKGCSSDAWCVSVWLFSVWVSATLLHNKMHLNHRRCVVSESLCPAALASSHSPLNPRICEIKCKCVGVGPCLNRLNKRSSVSPNAGCRLNKFLLPLVIPIVTYNHCITAEISTTAACS